VQKKKSKVVIEDLFADDVAEEEPIKPDVGKRGSTSVKTASPVASSSTILAAEKQDHSTQRKKLSSEARLERFNQIVDFVTTRLGRKPAVKMPEVRKSAWVHLVGLSTTVEQLEKVANMFPGWKESGHQFDPQFSELFVRKYSAALFVPLIQYWTYKQAGARNCHALSSHSKFSATSQNTTLI
jgi:hypothetical protein